MPIEQPPIRQRTNWIEGGILLCAAPFLLFPAKFPLLTTLVLLLIALLWLMPLFWRKWSWPAATPIDTLLLLWSSSIFLSILVTADPDLTLEKAAGVILGLALWRFSNRAMQSPFLVQMGLLFYLLLGAGFVAFGIINANWISKIPFISQITALFPDGVVVLPGTEQFGVHSNQIAATLLLLLPLLLSICIGLLGQRPLPTTKLLLAALPTAVATLLLLLTQSRTGWLAFAGTLLLLLILWLFFLPRHTRLRQLFAAAVLLLLLAGFGAIMLIGPARFVNIWQDPAQETLVGNTLSLGFRQEVWQWGVTAVQDFPFTGVGLGAFRHVVRRFYPVNITPTYDIAHAHNLYLQMALDVGLPGLIVYLAIISVILYCAIWAARRDESLRPYLIGLVATLGTLHIFGLADTLALGAKPHILFWLIISLIAAMHRLVYTHWQR